MRNKMIETRTYSETASSTETALYLVVVNQLEQYCIWPMGKQVPNGWVMAGKMGLKGECMAYLNDIWADRIPVKLYWRMIHTATRVQLSDPTKDGKSASETHHLDADVLHDWTFHDRLATMRQP